MQLGTVTLTEKSRFVHQTQNHNNYVTHHIKRYLINTIPARQFKLPHTNQLKFAIIIDQVLDMIEATSLAKCNNHEHFAGGQAGLGDNGPLRVPL